MSTPINLGKSFNDGEAFEIRRIAQALAERQIESLKLYQPMPLQAAFHQSLARERVVRGGNRAGKTMSAAAEVAKIVTGQDPQNRLRKTNGICYCVGFDGRHVGQVMWKKLGKAGAFKVIRDQYTNLWRSFMPWVPEDAARIKEAKQAPPLIPGRFIREIAWELKKEGLPKIVYLHNGWELHFFSGNSKPPMGTEIDLCLAGWSEVYDPVAKCMRRIDQIRGEWHVYGKGPKGVGIYRARQPFVKGIGELVRVTLSDGREIYSTRRHKVMSLAGPMVSVQEAMDGRVELYPSSLDACGRLDSLECPGDETPAAPTRATCQTSWQSPRSLWSGRSPESLPWPEPSILSPWIFPGYGDGHDLRELEFPGSLLGCWNDLHPYGARLPLHAETGPSAPPSPAGGLAHSHSHYSAGAGDGTEAGILLGRLTSSCVAFPPATARFHGDDSSPRPRPAPRILSSSCSQTSPQSSSWTGPADTELPLESDQSQASSALPVFVESVESLGEGPIWDFGVEEVHNYLHESIISSNCWFDEEIPDGEWYSEIAARLVDRQGHFIWSATPQAGTDRLFDLHERAEEQEQKNVQPRTVEEYLLHIDQNMHMSAQQRDEFKSKLSDDDKDVRIEGEFSRVHRVYPEYNPKVHEVPFMVVPANWTRHVAIDPGRQRGAALFMAVSPPDQGNLALIYDEIYIKDCDAYQFGDAMAEKCAEQMFRVFIIDDNEAAKHETGSGITIGTQYSSQLKRVGVKSQLTGHSFLPADDGERAGVEAVRAMFRRKSDGLKLQIMAEKCPNFVWEMKRYQYKKEGGRVTEKPRKKNDHLMDCLRYLCIYQPRWYPPPKPDAIEGASYRRFRLKQERKGGSGSVMWGPSGGGKK